VSEAAAKTVSRPLDVGCADPAAGRAATTARVMTGMSKPNRTAGSYSIGNA
jgi:hypothetical protein